MEQEDLIQRYEDARRRYENRIKSWATKFHAIIKPIPRVKHIKNITEKSIERLEKVIWPKISKRRKKEAQKEYEIRYENRDPSVYVPKPSYNPPTETDFLNNNIPETPQPLPQSFEESNEEPDEDGYTETVVSRDEIEAWIDANINTITVDRELDEVREQLNSLVLEAADSYGDYGEYLNYLEQNASRLNNLAQKAMSGYRGKGGKIYQEDSGALAEFATVLNLNRPLDQSQSERLENEGWVSYDFND